MTSKYFFYSLLISFVLLGFACDEVAPVLNPIDTGGGPVPVAEQERQVLIEEFTGVRCVNCPAGSAAIEALRAVYGVKLVAVSIHAGFFAQPYAESQENLATPIGNSILSLLGEPLGYPTAVVNRTRFNGEENRQVGQSTWAGYIAEELQHAPQVKIDLQRTYNEATREVTVRADLYIVENITDPDVRLTVYLTENNLSDSQLTPAGQQNDYIHKHVFRTALGAFDGDQLSESLVAGAVVSRSFTYTLAANWNPEECHIVAFVHRGGSDLKVLQAHEVGVVE
ncbi:MAG: hypothetical protein DA408_02225 [Bacteroidetes bacterium]|nr:MAG: hypothetical protein C7N36_00910 [Bacteroidota bacterium]PTM14628.1 MAG: hypothetical protein DA408_02225 [Bacteroidota bacterium]